MKFLCLCHYESARFAELTPADFEEIGAICAPHDAALKASGKVEMIGALGMPEQSRTLRAEHGAVTDLAGPYHSTPELFGAFFIVEADDVDGAVEIAKLHPGTHLGDKFGRGGIEVRPIEFIERP
ncbi:YciI family protein [Sphingomonas sp.]|uniref:YciI family protein n=1 Tax=Sphingomonas sp. TaxID=28214 RepID=UPI0025FED98D|nr:YciI family protein [Sphingomonas sp.]